MPNTAYGTYKNGQIILDTSDLAIEESRVQVIFLDKNKKKGNNLLDFTT
jgi:hypothetical protein